MVDVTNQEKRGFAVGVNEFAGYFGVTIGGIIISYFTDLYDIRSFILIISIIFLIFTIIQTLNFIEETYPNNLNNDENIFWKKTKPKHIYVYYLNKKIKRQIKSLIN